VHYHEGLQVVDVEAKMDDLGAQKPSAAQQRDLADCRKQLAALDRHRKVLELKRKLL